MMLLDKVRVISGKWKGRKIKFPSQESLRPTAERVRETLFSWLLMHLENSKCLDLFAGSGILGIESLSRGAKSVTAIDSSIAVKQAIEENLNTIGGKENYNFIKDDVLSWLDSAKLDYDVIFLDPPFSKGLLYKVLEKIYDKKTKALIYFESGEKLDSEKVAKKFEVLKEKRAGQVHYGLLKVL